MSHFHLPTLSRHARIVLVVIAAALIFTVVAAYAFIPPVRNYVGGPSADAVAAQRNLARAEDLATQNQALTAKLNDTASKSAKEIADLTAALNDNKTQLDEANKKLSEPDENAAKAAQAATDKARADSLKSQLDKAQADADKKLAAKDADAVSAQARADDLKKQINDIQAEPIPVANITKQEIIDSKRVLGAYTAQAPFDYGTFDQLERSLDRDMHVAGSFADFSVPFRSKLVTEPWLRKQIPLITLEPQIIGKGTDQPEFSNAKIIDGSWDKFLTQWALDAKATGLPFILRWAQEPQLVNAYPWADGENGNAYGSYAAAYRHVWELFESVGANENIVWMFCVNRINRIPNRPLPAAYYPGSKYADIVAYDAYFRNSDLETDRTAEDTLGPTQELMKQFGKPVWVAETGATDKDGFKEAWTKSLFEYVAKPETGISGVMLFSLTITSSQGTQAWQLDSTREVQEIAKAGLVSSGFGRTVGSDTPPERGALQAPPSTPPLYGNCLAVWTVLGRSITPQDAGYSADLDRDGNGIGCETDPR